MSKQTTPRIRTIEERAAVINEMTEILHDMRHQHGGLDQPLERLMGLLMELAHAPEFTHESALASEDPRFGMARKMLEPAIHVVRLILHETGLVKAGEEWTIGLATSCGFNGRMILQTDAVGSCSPIPEEVPCSVRPDEQDVVPWPFHNLGGPDNIKH